MERRKTKHIPNKTQIDNGVYAAKKILYESDSFFKKPIVKKVTKGLVIGGVIFVALYTSKYFLNATANMIRSGKDLKNALRE